jgi:hypothetical protein
MPAASAITTASASTACVQPTISWLIIFAARPLPDGPMCVTRAATSGHSAAAASKSAGSPPAITVSVPAALAGGPPDTGASAQPAPVCERSLDTKPRPRPSSTVEKSTIRAPGAIVLATPSGPKTA